MHHNKPLRIGITHGDFNGVGYEIILKTFSDNRINEEGTFILYGSEKIANYYRKLLNLPPISFHIIQTPDEAQEGKLNIIEIGDEDHKVELGVATQKAGKSAYDALEYATAHLKSKEIDVLITAPINKHNIQSKSFSFKGHTEYLESKFAGEKQKSLMILACDNLRVALVTGHIPLSEVSKHLTKERIIETVTLFEKSLKGDFGIQKPRIAVLSLNPHAGDNGLIGTEEQTVIEPAIKAMKSENSLVFGPYPSDGFWGSGSFSRFDGVVAMYHDQGLAPFKTLAMDQGVNFTAGLPIVRTSPAHGTGYDIVGKDMAKEDSFRASIYLAIDIFKKRKWLHEISKNPLRKHHNQRGRAKDESVDITQEDKTD